MSQETLAREAGIDRTYVSLVERGLRIPTLRTLLRLAEVLEVQQSDIVRGMEKRLPQYRCGSRASGRP